MMFFYRLIYAGSIIGLTSCGLEQAHEDRTIACAESKEPATDALIMGRAS